MGKGKVKPPPEIGTHTDATDWSTDPAKRLLSEWGNLTVVDAPGYDTLTHPTGTFIKLFPFAKFDTILFVAKGKLHASDEDVFRSVVRSGVRACVARSHAESLEGEEMDQAVEDLRDKLNIPETYDVFVFSNRTQTGIPAIQKFVQAG